MSNVPNQIDEFTHAPLFSIQYTMEMVCGGGSATIGPHTTHVTIIEDCAKVTHQHVVVFVVHEKTHPS